MHCTENGILESKKCSFCNSCTLLFAELPQPHLTVCRAPPAALTVCSLVIRPGSSCVKGRLVPCRMFRASPASTHEMPVPLPQVLTTKTASGPCRPPREAKSPPQEPPLCDCPVLLLRLRTPRPWQLWRQSRALAQRGLQGRGSVVCPRPLPVQVPASSASPVEPQPVRCTHRGHTLTCGGLTVTHSCVLRAAALVPAILPWASQGWPHPFLPAPRGESLGHPGVLAPFRTHERLSCCPAVRTVTAPRAWGRGRPVPPALGGGPDAPYTPALSALLVAPTTTPGPSFASSVYHCCTHLRVRVLRQNYTCAVCLVPGLPGATVGYACRGCPTLYSPTCLPAPGAPPSFSFPWLPRPSTAASTAPVLSQSPCCLPSSLWTCVSARPRRLHSLPRGVAGPRGHRAFWGLRPSCKPGSCFMDTWAKPCGGTRDWGDRGQTCPAPLLQRHCGFPIEPCCVNPWGPSHQAGDSGSLWAQMVTRTRSRA